MHKLNRFVVMFALVSLVTLGALGFVGAQDTAPATTVQCDSDLILNLYTADRFFGFSRVRDQLAASGADTTQMVDLNIIDKGQFTPWFDTAMVDSLRTTTTGANTSLGLNDEQITTLSSTLMLDDAARQEMLNNALPSVDTSTLTTLPAPAIAGEAPDCTNLRTELNRFFATLALSDLTGTINLGVDMTGGQTQAQTGALTGDVMSWTTALSGAAEIPGPGDPDGAGSASISVDTPNSQICYTLFVQNLTLPAQAAHIHRGAAGVSGDVVVPFDLAPDASGNATSCVAVDPALLTEIAQNPAGFYVNVHTSDFPDGALRGQVIGP